MKQRALLITLASLGLALSGAAIALASPDAADHKPPQGRRAPDAPRLIGEIGRRIAAAAPGDTIEVGPGVYAERLRIDKPLTLIGKGSPIIDGGGVGDVIEIIASDVTIKGFTIRNSGISLDRENAGIHARAPRIVIEDNILQDILFGIDLSESTGSIVRGNRIGGKDLNIARRGDGLRLWRSNDTLIENNVIHDGRDALLWYSTNVTIRGNRAERCRYGLHLMFSDQVVIEHCVLTDNSVGIYLMYGTGIEVRGNQLIRNRGPSGYGIGLKETDQFSVTDNLVTGNRVGVYIDGSPFTDAKPGEFTHNTFAYNDVGFLFLPSARGNELFENNFIDNIDQISVAGRGDLSANRFWKGERGNFWSDYTGYDQDGDGVGDFVHESQTLFENMMDKEPKLRLFLFSPAQQAIEFVGRAVPAVRPEPKFVDEVPLMRPVPIGVEVQPRRWAVGLLAATGLGLLALGASVVSAAWRSPRGARGGPAQSPKTKTGGAS